MNSLGVAALFLAAAGLVIGLLFGLVRKDTALPSPAAAQEWWEIREIQQADGTWKESGRRKWRAQSDGSIIEVKKESTHGGFSQGF